MMRLRDEGFWSHYCSVYDQGITTLHPYRELNEEVLTCLDLRANSRLLDAGCGTGYLLERMLRLARPPSLMVGVERNEAFAERALGKVRRAGDRCQVIVEDLMSPALSDRLPAPFTHAVSVNVLYDLPDPHGFLRTVYNLLAPGGRLVLVNAHIPEFQPVFDAHDRWLETATEEERVSDAANLAARKEALRCNAMIREAALSGEVHFTSPEVLDAWLKTAGFNVDHVQGGVYAGINVLGVAVRS